MAKIILDNNVFCAIVADAGKRNENVDRWFDSVDSTDIFFTSVVVEEIYFGIQHLKNLNRLAEANLVEDKFVNFINDFKDRILCPNFHSAKNFGVCVGNLFAPKPGCYVDHLNIGGASNPKKVFQKSAHGLNDLRIATIALFEGATVATRDQKFFKTHQVLCIDPF